MTKSRFGLMNGTSRVGVCVIFIVERAANLTLLLDLTSKKPHAGPIFFAAMSIEMLQ